MNKSTIVLILLSVLLAGGLSHFQYFYKAKNKSNTTKFLAFLRFLSIFGLLLLLINPIVSRSTFETIKNNLGKGEEKMKPQCGFWKWLWLTISGRHATRKCYFCFRRWDWRDPCLGFSIQGWMGISCPYYGKLSGLK